MRNPPPVHDRLLATIAAHGPIPLADYMAQTNSHYYATRDPLGADGDFTTAPEISQMFGELVGLAIADMWDRAGRPDAAYVELGPGRGTLARDALGAMAAAGLNPSVHLVETSPTLAAKQGALVPQATHHASHNSLPSDRPLLIVANEFFDALPVRQLVRTDAGWREMMVGCDGDVLVRMAGNAPREADVPRPLHHAPVGSIHEINGDAQAIVAALATRIAAQGGALLIIDYGYVGPALGDTLQAVRGHGFADPLANAGEADLTAHVDFSALAAAAAQLSIAGPVGQGDWLTRLGIDARAAALAARNPDRTADLTAQRDRLVKADAMGQLFRVLALYHPEWPTPAGFAL
ncbi:MAG: SAM-dependent methyltransferase [Sphingopyxis sp.]|nr:SAM-dependent methyltransferase [Sphingopyxis sp.]